MGSKEKSPERPALDTPIFRSELLRLLKRPRTRSSLTKALGCDKPGLHAAIVSLRAAGYRVSREGETYCITRTPGEANRDTPAQLNLTREPLQIGVISDTHLCSRFAREDVLHRAYGEFKKAGVKTVLHAGNLVDGESRFNRHELLAHGIADQTDFALQHYPSIAGISTWFIDGDDHEGWWRQREGLRFGQYLVQEGVSRGRTDLRYLGYGEADIKLSGLSRPAVIRVCHPGGGSAYATSYKAQKLVEAMGPTEKPDVFIVGHYHKMGYFRPRNVHVILAGCCQDQSWFMRKQHIDAQIGFYIMTLTRDTNGAVIVLDLRMFQFFDRKYHEAKTATL